MATSATYEATAPRETSLSRAVLLSGRGQSAEPPDPALELDERQ
jgi:hypothetical protein